MSLAWLLARPEVSSVIIGARDLTQLRDNLAAVSLALSPLELSRLDTASAQPLGYPYEFIASTDR